MPGRPLGALESGDPGDPIEIVARRVGTGADEATRERALRVVLTVKDTFWGGQFPNREHDVLRPVVDAWLAASPGSPERVRLEKKAREAARTHGARDYYAAMLCDVVGGHAEPGRVAGAAVHNLARQAQAVAYYFVPNLVRLLNEAGFGAVEES
ncbi:MAG: hypothetical protein M9894_39680 [Planctomycetes bacterium]|nr:hypothetical protein [Planctomycetota bacterium]